MFAVNLPPIPSEITFSDLLVIVMSFLGLMIALASLIVTAAGVAIGVLGFLGWQFFQKEVGQKAKDSAELSARAISEQVAGTVARDIVAQYFKGDEFGGIMESIREQIILSSATVTPETAMPLSDAESRKRVGPRYPKKGTQGRRKDLRCL